MNLDSITTLDLSNMNIDDSYCFKLAKALKYNHTVTELNLSYNYIFHDGARAIFNMLKKNNTIRTLILNNNYIGTVPYLLSEYINTYPEYLNNCKLITTLGEDIRYVLGEYDFGCSYLDNHYLVYQSPKISSMLKVNTTLEELHLSNSKYRDIKDLKYGLSYNKTLKCLYLGYNELLFNECDSKEFKTYITHLDLSGNNNHQVGYGKIYYDKLISSVIENSTTITHLFLDDFDFGRDNLIHAFTTNKTITHFFRRISLEWPHISQFASLDL